MRTSQFIMPSPVPFHGLAESRSLLAACLRGFSVEGRLFLLLLTLYFGGGAACADTNSWTRQSVGLDPGSITALAINPATPTTLYAGTGGISSLAGLFKSMVGGVIYKSTDGGATWVVAKAGLTNAGVSTLVISPATPTTVYAGMSWGGVFKSMDGGATWVEANTGLTDTGVYSLAINPATPTTLYAGTGRGGIFKSTDGGATWAEANTGLTDFYVPTLAINPATPTTVYAGTGGGGVFKSTDGGATWAAANTGLTNTSVRTLAINPATPATIYAGVGFDGVFKSTDGGATWATVNTGLPVTPTGHSIIAYALAINPAMPTTLYAGAGFDGVFKSTDGGATWVAVNMGLTGAVVRTLAITPATPTILYAGTLSGVFQFDESNPIQNFSDADRIFNYLEATYPQYLSPAKADSAIMPEYYYRYYSGTNAYIATSNGMVYYLGPASGNSILLLGMQANYIRAATISGF